MVNHQGRTKVSPCQEETSARKYRYYHLLPRGALISTGISLSSKQAASFCRKWGTLQNWVRPNKRAAANVPLTPLPEHLANATDELPLFFRRKKRADSPQIKAIPDETSQQVYYRTVRSGFDRQEPRKTAACRIVPRQQTGKNLLKPSSAEF